MHSAHKANCTRCDRRCSNKNLTDLGPGGIVCPKCLDHTPSAERRSLLRKAGQR